MSRKSRATLLILLFISGGIIWMNAHFTGCYRIVENPYQSRAADYHQARYLIITVKKTSRTDTRIKILLKLAELFAEEEVNFDQCGKIRLKEVFDALKARGKKYMAEFTDPKDGDKAWFWFE